MAAFSAVNDLRDTLGPAIGVFLYFFAACMPWMIGAPIALRRCEFGHQHAPA